MISKLKLEAPIIKHTKKSSAKESCRGIKVNLSGETMFKALSLDCSRQLIVHLFECTLVIHAGRCAFAWPPKSSVPLQRNRRERATSLRHKMVSKLRLEGPIMKHTRSKAV